MRFSHLSPVGVMHASSSWRRSETSGWSNRAAGDRPSTVDASIQALVEKVSPSVVQIVVRRFWAGRRRR